VAHGVLPSDGLVWRLHGNTAKDVEGYVTRTTAGDWLVRLIRDSECVLNETYPDAGSALTRAAVIRDGLVAKGWVQVPTSANAP
jgi:hypothetical protein